MSVSSPFLFGPQYTRLRQTTSFEAFPNQWGDALHYANKILSPALSWFSPRHSSCRTRHLAVLRAMGRIQRDFRNLSPSSCLSIPQPQDQQTPSVQTTKMQLPTILATILSLAALGAATPVAPTLESRAGSCNPEGKPSLSSWTPTYLAHISRKHCPNTSVIP